MELVLEGVSISQIIAVHEQTLQYALCVWVRQATHCCDRVLLQN